MKPEVCLAAKRRILRCNEVLSGRAEGGWSPRRGLFCQDRAKMAVMNPGLGVSTASKKPTARAGSGGGSVFCPQADHTLVQETARRH